MLLTEQEIRGLSIGFLKNHYKFRPHKVWNGIKVRNERHDIDGIIIDASLTYVQQDGSQFLATVEASSSDRSKEVYYRFHWFRLLFEALTLSLLVLAIVYGLLGGPWSEFLVTYGQSGGWLSVLNLFTAALATFSLLLMLYPKRYRYIYAIEQFKLFHADDQWIAYDAELFHTHEDSNYRELERQCMYYGFGLLQVERDRRIRVMVSPKRGDYFGQKRKKLPVWAATISQAPLLGKAVEKRLGGIVEVDETIQLKDPLAEMNFELPEETTAPEEVPLPSPSAPKTTSGPLGKLKNLLPKRQQSNSVSSDNKLTISARLRKLFQDNQPSVFKELPGFFSPPARWSSLFLFALVANVSILVWRLGQSQIEPLITKEDRLRLERTYERRAPGGPELEANLNDMEMQEDAFSLGGSSAEPSAVIDEDQLEKLAPKAASDVMLYSLGVQGDTIVSDRCIAFSRSGQRLYSMVFGRYNNLDAALDDAFKLHTDLNKDILVTKGDCLQQPATDYIVMIGKPSADEGEINLRFRQLRRDAGLNIEILAFD